MKMREVYLKNILELFPYLSNGTGDSCKSGNLDPEEWYHSFCTSLRKADSRLGFTRGEYL